MTDTLVLSIGGQNVLSIGGQNVLSIGTGPGGTPTPTPTITYADAATALAGARSVLGDLSYFAQLYALQWQWCGLNTWADATNAYPQGKLVVPGQFVFPKPSPIPGYVGYPVDVDCLLRTWTAVLTILKLTRKGSATGPGPAYVSPGSGGDTLILSIGGQNVLSIGGQNVLSIGTGGTPIVTNGAIAGVVLPPAPPAWVFRYFGYRL
jgi:hypothetical protein